MADIAILAAGPNDLAYYFWGGFSTLYAISIPSLMFGVYSNYFGSGWEKTVADKDVAFYDQFLTPGDVESRLTSGAYSAILFMAPMALWFILGLFWEGAFTSGMSIIGTISFIGMVFFAWVGSYLDDLFLNASYSENMWIVTDDATR